MDLFWKVVSWFAIFVVSVSYWFQVWRIHVHREVRDLSMMFYGLFLLGVSLLCVQAYREDSTIFFTKQILVIIPVIIIIFQIIYHRQDSWHEEDAESCVFCGAELEALWKSCPHCSCVQSASDVVRLMVEKGRSAGSDATDSLLLENPY
ncbi:PQ-loop repeat-containing protein [Oligoflexaceae bacterium]|nr:PQ-loop repeat-containing protein [Oligoflexaceae bacterium]